MKSVQAGPIRPPLKPAPELSGLGKAIPAPTGEWRDPVIFGELNARVAAEEQQEKEERTSRVKRKRRPATSAGNAGTESRRKLSARAKKSERPESDTFRLAKEIAIEAAGRIRAELGEGLSWDESVRIAKAFRSAVVPRRRPGRQPSTRVTAAYADWKLGMTARELCEKHIPGWRKHNRYRRNGEMKALMDAIRSRRRREQCTGAQVLE